MKKIKNRIFVDKKFILNSKITLDVDQVHYLRNVLRIRTGDYMSIFNDELICLTKVENIKKNLCELYIIECEQIKKESHNITLFFSLIKRTPLETMIQKCTEIGVSTFQPVIMKRTNIKNINFERLNLIAIEACEQSTRNTIPEINRPISFDSLINNKSLKNYLYCSLEKEKEKISDRKLLRNEPIGIIIGPEGDFTVSEYKRLKLMKNSFGVSLGPNILKSETAAIAASSIIMNQIYNA